MNLETHGVVGPVTALCVYDNRIFAGCGSQVQVYSAATGELLTSCSVFPCATVHRLELGPVLDGKKHLCVFGAKCMRIFSLGAESAEVFEQLAVNPTRLESTTAVREFEDWIWAAAWLQNHENASGWTVALALAHNVVLHWDWQTDCILHRATCVEKCILYCGHFIGRRWSDLVLAAGTVFNQVVLWSPGGEVPAGCEYAPGPQPVLHRLTGHQGVIFSVFYHRGLQRICSVSDDRSIILYQLHSLPPSWQSPDVDAAPVDWNQVTIEPMLSVFGHSGRVWDVVLLKDCFVSVGEDTNCIVWNYNGEILHKHKGHRGQSIWSLATSEDESFVVTGGGDCSIRKWQLDARQDSPLTQSQLIVPNHVKMSGDDFVRSLALWDFDDIVMVTNAGSTLSYSMTRDTWHTLAHDTDFASYATLAVSGSRSSLAVGAISGHVRVIWRLPGTAEGVCETKVRLYSSKVCGLTWVDDNHLLATGLQGRCTLVRVQQTAEERLVLSTVAQLELPTCKHRWVTSACLLLMSSSSTSSSSSLSQSQQSLTWAHLVCGDRSGSVHHYQLTSTDSQSQTESVLLPVQMFPKIHGSAGVTCVCHHDGTVYTAGRDGQYRRWSLDTGCLQLLNSSRVFKGFDWIDHLWIKDQQLFILGFYSSKFVVWAADQGERQLEVECGGGHRSWDCLSRGHDYRFCFIKAREVMVVNSRQRSSQDIVKPPLHGKKVWDMKCLSTCTDDKGGLYHVLCTGSEDTTLSLGVLQSDLEGNHSQWTGQHTLHAHLSSVRSLAAVSSACSPQSRSLSGHGHLPDLGTGQRTCFTDVGPHLSEERSRWSDSPGSTTMVFSGGGRAQIQAWRVTVSEQVSHPQQTMDERDDRSPQTLRDCCRLSHDPDTTSVNVSTAALPVCDLHQSEDMTHKSCSAELDKKGVKSSRPSDPAQVMLNTAPEDQSADGPSVAMTSPCPRNPQRPVTAHYEHLGGCFLGESRHKRSHKPWKTRYLKLDPETRVMGLAAVRAPQLHSSLSPHLHLVAAAGSDAVLRLFLFDELQRRFTLLCQSSHHRGCILKVLIHLLPDSPSHPCNSLSDHAPILLSAATDGRVAVWDLRPVVTWLCSSTKQQIPDAAASAPGDDDRCQLRAPDEAPGDDDRCRLRAPDEAPGDDDRCRLRAPDEAPGDDDRCRLRAPDEAPGDDDRCRLRAPDEAPGDDDRCRLRAPDGGKKADLDVEQTRLKTSGSGNETDLKVEQTRLKTSGSGNETDLKVEQTRLKTPGSENETGPEVEQTRLKTPGSGNETDLDVEQTRLKTPGSGNETDLKVEQTDAVRHQQYQVQELTEDESSDDEDDGKTDTPHSTDNVQSAVTKAQYLGDEVPPLFVPAFAGPGGSGVESCVGEGRTGPAAAEGGSPQGWSPAQELEAHQSGVNSLHIKSLADGSLLLATGGDDNALTVHRLAMAADGFGARGDKDCHHGHRLFDVVGKVCKADAHAAQITGVWVLSQTHVLTASVDQRVSLWRLTQDSQIRLERCCFVNVADPSNIEVWQHKDRLFIGLCGEGVALLSVQGHTAD